jgi:tRNA threonylcarbamoyladenosine biosynthesis protein TsaE
MVDELLAVRTRSDEQTKAVGAALAGVCVGGDLIVLTGDLGAGKTTFTQGLAAGLGVDAPVTSPTFTLAHRYEGSLVVNHLDVYRLEDLSEVIDLGLAELLDGDAVTLIEWGEAIAPALPSAYLQVRLELEDAPDERRVAFEAVGPRWVGRVEAARDQLVAAGAGRC